MPSRVYDAGSKRGPRPAPGPSRPLARGAVGTGRAGNSASQTGGGMDPRLQARSMTSATSSKVRP